MANLLEQWEAEQFRADPLPRFTPGDTVIVHVKVKEGERERLQAFDEYLHGRGMS